MVADSFAEAEMCAYNVSLGNGWFLEIVKG